MVDGLQRLSGKTAVITGAAQGLGRALAIRMAKEGAHVVVGDLNDAGAKETAELIGDARSVQVDITDYNSCENLMQTAYHAFGPIDILVCNAAVLVSGPIEEFDPARWKFVIDVNLCGFFNTVKAATPYLNEESASIIQINSKSGKKGSFRNSAYAASKFGGIGLVQSLALEFAERGTRVNAICPGNLLDSPLWTQSLFKQYAANQGITEKQVREKYINQVPMKRGCQYEDVENLMVFLASEESAYITGQAMNVTGGQQMS